MSEFIREVDEDYRQEQVKRFLLRYRVPIVVGLVLILLGAAGWRFHLHRREQAAEAAGARYFAATERAATDRAASVAALDALAKDAPPGYALLARFRAAGETGQGDAAAGSAAFEALAADGGIDPDWRDVARLRAALLLADTAPPAELERRLAPMADANAPFRNIARETLAAVALRAGDDAGARRWSEAVVADATATPDQRQRAALVLALVRAGKPSVGAPVPPAVTAPITPAMPPALDTPAADTPATIPPASGEP